MILARDFQVGVVYVSDDNGIYAFIVTALTPTEKGVNITYRWIDHQFLSEYDGQVFKINERLDFEFRYHAEPFMIQEFP